MNTATSTIPTIHRFTAPSGEVSVWADGSVVIGYPDSSAISYWQWNGFCFSVTYKSDTSKTYFYNTVTIHDALGLLSAPSAGKFVAEHIKAKHEVAWVAVNGIVQS